MPRLKKLREPGDTQVRKAWNKKKTRKYTIAITLDEKKENRRKAAKKPTKASPAKKTTTKKAATKKPRKASKAGSKGKARRGSK